ncbi:MAG: endolytic transglycosylase MltG [Syntrophales bacterium]|nr:endolytic transglycosylase MltG [Syntrophales bacterium]
MLKLIKRYNIFSFTTIIIIPILLSLTFLNYTVSPSDNKNRTSTVIILRGAGFLKVTDILYKAGQIKYRPFFCLLAVLKNAPKNIKAGEYELVSSMSPIEIIDKLVRGEIKKYLVLVPEDITLREIATRLVSLGLVDENEFMTIASDPSFLSSLGIDGATVEGYLFPDTYTFNRAMGAREIIETMVHQFRKKVNPEMIKRAGELGLTVSEFVTLASIIGKESGRPEEKPLISAVFHNRLKRGMKLQSDPTAVYDVKNFDGNIKKSDLRRDTLHNTYKINGLPPGPIANPGIDSLYATLYPAHVGYLYFVSKNDSSHHFSSNLTAHNEAVLRYQSEMKKK